MSETLTPPHPPLDGLRTRFRPILILLAAFALISAAMESVLVVQTATGTSIDSAIWIRCSLVLASSILLLLIATSASRGSRRAWIRVRIISVIVVVAVIVIVSIPGFLPDWVRIEQGACGALVLPVAILLNLPHTVALYRASPSAEARRVGS
jgi:cellulose synthase/poly-beta-1,6-N-acetylglucosamine synthase-like glycosyltransferase